MEVSSHAVEQKRIAGMLFSGAVFTNLTHDHLDYHGTFAHYLKAKKRFFDDLPKSAFAIVNADDKNGKVMLQNTVAATYFFGLKNKADFKTKVIENNLSGLHLLLDGTEVFARMMGDFNASNLTAVYGTALLLGADKLNVLTILSDLRGAEGRFDAIPHPQIPKCVGIIDYAHTPDALEKVLDTILKMKGKSGKIITVVGCGGDRDKTKRPIMAKVAALRSHQLILTNDNPRTESPTAILQDMEAGLDSNDLKKTLFIENREQAIKTAAMMAKEGDIILIAGKGHEKYQDINGTKHPFDDMAVLQKCFAAAT
jgi:UDP-N-acetylmuramoyl-L-alanyl-D-glutamate--2,6-diaminopimelate ligase